MLAAKFFDDAFFANSFYARVGGIKVEELNQLELNFIACINFSLFVCQEDFLNYYNEIFHYVEVHLSPCCGASWVLATICRLLKLPISRTGGAWRI